MFGLHLVVNPDGSKGHRLSGYGIDLPAEKGGAE
jgi:hypothetical protein